jgi:peptidoglycan/LPS O-acetylase OafA/YrhL
MAVEFLFVISGFLIARSWEMPPSLSRYLQKRAAGIVPGFVVASFVGFLIGVPSVHDIGVCFRGINIHNFLLRIFNTTSG